MLQAKNSLIGNNIVNNNEMTGSPLNNPTVIEYPKLEDLTVVPTKEQQEFESKKYYGYKKVIVEGVESEVLDVKPSEETQIIEGLFDTVKVEKIETEEKEVELDFSDADINEIIPSEGKYLKSVLIEKSPDLEPENIIKDKIINGVKGNVEILDTFDSDATENDLIAPKTAYVKGKKITGNIITNYTSASLGSAKMYNSEKTFNDIDPLKGIATSFDNDNIMIHKIDSNYKVLKTFTIPVAWKTTTTKEILSAKIFKGTFDTGYIIYILTLDITSPFYIIKRFVISKELNEILSETTYTETYTTGINDGMCLDIERKNVAVPSPTDPYLVAYICFASLGTWNYHWNYGYVSKIDFSTNPPTVTRSERIQHFNTSGNVKNSEGIINIIFDETGKYISCLFTMEERIMNIASVYHVPTMATIISTIDVAVTSVRSKPLFNIENEVYTISDGKLLMLNEASYSEVGTISNSILGYRSYYKTFKDNIFLMPYDTRTITRYALSSSKTSFLLKQTINNGNEFNIYKTGVTAQNNTYIYDYNVSNSGEISDIEMSGKKFYDTSNTTTSDKILKGEIAYTDKGKTIGTMPNNGRLIYTPSIEPQTIPAGYTSGGIIEAGGDTSDATATPDDILSPATAYVNGEKIEGTMLSTYEKINLSWEITKKSGKTNPAIFGMNDKYLFYYNSTTSNFVLENIETGEIDTLSSSIYSFTTGQWASIVLGCIYNDTECYGIAVSEGSQQGLFIRVKNNKIVTYKVQNVNDYNRVLMLTPGKTHPNLFCSEYRSNSSGGKSMRIFTLDTNLDFSYSNVVYMLYSDYSIIGTFAKNDSYYISISGSGTGKTMKSMYMKYLKWSGTTLSSVSNVSNPVSTIYYCNDDMTYLISGETLYTLGTSTTSVTATSLKTISYTGTGLFFLGNFFITYSGTNIYVYELKDSTLSLVKQLTLNTSVNLQYVNTNNKEALFQAGSYMEYLKYDGEKIFTKITRGEEEFYKPYDADITADDIRKGKIAYGVNGKIEGTLEGGGEYNAVIDSSLVPTRTSGSSNALATMITKIPEIDTSQWTSAESMFSGCTYLTEIPQLDTSNITKMNNMFYACSTLETIPPMDTSKVTNMYYMFRNCTNLKTIPQMDTSNVTDMGYMFENCTSLTELPLLDMSNVTNMSGFIRACKALKTIPLIYAPKMKSYYGLFYECNSLETIPFLNTTHVTNMASMFYKCYKLQTIPQLDTVNVTNMGSMFYDCRKLQSIPQLDTVNVTNMERMFSMDSRSLLESVPELKGESLTNVNNIFYGTSNYFNNFTNFGGLKDLGKAYTQKSNNYSNYKLNLSYCTELTHDSLMNVINNLYDLNLTYDVANGGTLYTQSLQLGSTNLAKLTAEEIRNCYFKTVGQ